MSLVYNFLSRSLEKEILLHTKDLLLFAVHYKLSSKAKGKKIRNIQKLAFNKKIKIFVQSS